MAKTITELVDELKRLGEEVAAALAAGDLLTPGQVEKATGLTRQQITKALLDGELTGWRVGRSWFTTPASVAEWRTRIGRRPR